MASEFFSSLNLSLGNFSIDMGTYLSDSHSEMNKNDKSLKENLVDFLMDFIKTKQAHFFPSLTTSLGTLGETSNGRCMI